MRTEQPAGRDPSTLMFPLIICAAGVLALSVYVIVGTGTWIDTGSWVAGNPIAVDTAVMKGDLAWSGWSTATSVAFAVLVVVAVALVVQLRGSRTSVDRKAGHMGRGDNLTRRAATRKAAAGKLGGVGAPGLVFGTTVQGKRDVYIGREDGVLVIMGPRKGKSTAVAIPAAMQAPGALFATSSKRDFHDAIVGGRAAVGDVKVFDPQQIAGQPASWVWNPLSYITSPSTASTLAFTFADAAAPAGSKRDAHFDVAGPAMLAGMLHAAAVNGDPITVVLRWLGNPEDLTPVRILDAAGQELPAAALQGAYSAADKEKSGLFSTAAKSMRWLISPEMQAWVVPSADRPEFLPAEFVKPGARPTLIALSKEGNGSAGALTAALTQAVLEAAETEARRHPHGRLPGTSTLTAVLDEVCNCARLSTLPGLYSFYGSTGITLISIAQSYSQLVGAFGEHGASTLWSAATLRIVGGGLAERQFLSDVSVLTGERWVQRRSVGTSRNGNTSNVSSERQAILSPDDIAALPEWRAVLVPSGDYPVLIRTIPWWKRPDMETVVAASITANEPK